MRGQPCVAPCAGARIETRSSPMPSGCAPCRSLRGSADRNLNATFGFSLAQGSLPARERGSKRMKRLLPALTSTSLPARERGSKHHVARWAKFPELSLPARERGSKLADRHVDEEAEEVAPCAGARIETGSMSSASSKG